MAAATADIGEIVAELVELATAVPGLRCYGYAPSGGELHPPMLVVMDVEPRWNA